MDPLNETVISTNKAVVVTALELSIDVFLSLLEYDIQKSVQTAKYTCQSLFQEHEIPL